MSDIRLRDLREDPEFGRYFNELSNRTYSSLWRIESKEGEFARDAIDGNVLTTKIYHDVETTLLDLPTLQELNEVFQTAVADAMPDIKGCIKEVVDQHVSDGKFYGNGHHARQIISEKVLDVVGQKLKL